MKYRPLCTSYLTDAIGRLEEVAVHEERPQLVIEPVIGTSLEESSSESECEEAVQEVPPPAPRARIHKRPLLSLDDDAGFEYIEKDPVQKANDMDIDSLGSSNEQRRTTEQEDSMSLEAPAAEEESASNRNLLQDTQDEIDSVDSSSDEEMPVKPFKLVTQVSKKKRPSASIPVLAVQHPLEDTDEELDGVASSSGNRRLTKKLLPSVVDVTLKLSPVESLLASQSQCFPMDDGERDDAEHVVTTMDLTAENTVLASVRAVFLMCAYSYRRICSFSVISHVFFPCRSQIMIVASKGQSQ